MFSLSPPTSRARLARGDAATVLVVTINETFKTPGKTEVVRGEPADQV